MHGMTGSIFVVLFMFGSAVGMFSARSAAAEPLVPQSQAGTEDSYIAGYAAAILERDFRVSSGAVRVQQGVIIVNAPNLVGAQQQKIVETLSSIRGVTRVELQENGQVLASTPAISPSAAAVQRDVKGTDAQLASVGSTFLPDGYLFDQLLADPKWPHFSIAYIHYLHDKEIGSAGKANFGETLTFYRDQAPFGGQWEVGIQAGVYSLFDLEAASKDLINADYRGGVFAAYRTHDFSTILRVFHQSSHLGDEFVLRNTTKRVNLSYEEVDALISYKFFQSVRLYGGGGYLFDQEPSDLKPGRIQYGAEFESPWTYGNGAFRPVLAANLQNEEESNWSTDISLRGGIQFENWQLGSRKLQLLVEYFKGYSPNGQFYTRKIETIGIGAHLRF